MSLSDNEGNVLKFEPVEVGDNYQLSNVGMALVMMELAKHQLIHGEE